MCVALRRGSLWTFVKVVMSYSTQQEYIQVKIIKILPNRIYAALFVALAATMFLQAKDARAQGDGPLAYQLLPQGTKVVALWGLHTNGNQTADPGTVVQDGKINVNLGILQYIHTFRLIKDQQAALFGVLPFGKLDGSMNVQGVKV